MQDWPLLVVACIVSAYWIGVGAMIVRVRRHRHADAGLVPEQPRERLMWLVIVPLVLAWIVLPWLALRRDGGPLAVPDFAHAEVPFILLRWLAAAAAIVAFAATARCWKRMGDDWRMDVSSRHSALITDGPFQRIRHPIYAFQVLLMLATLAALPTVPMLVIAVVHLVVMQAKARNEEAHLAAMHGEAYARYMARTGRFVPRLTARGP